MDGKTIFNSLVCIFGISFLLAHVVYAGFKKAKRGDEKNLLVFAIFTIVLLTLQLMFTILSIYYHNDALTMCFNTVLFIMNNGELLLLFAYTVSYIPTKRKVFKTTIIINLTLFGIFVLLDIINIFTHMFFYSVNGNYTRTKVFFLSQGYQAVAFGIVLFLAISSHHLTKLEKLAFTSYCLIPLAAIILQDIFEGYALGYLSIVFTAEIFFLFLDMRKSRMLSEEEKKNREAEIRIMMSQIQPHFIYNVLASISTLIKINPDKAQEGLDTFTEYLRANFACLTDTGLISFSDELRHIETYLSLEKMRFDDRLNVIYDIKKKDFIVPPLSLQPIVENAVKHGILKKIEGGTVTIKVYDSKDANIVEISDDGVGFDPNNIGPTNHYGINNVKYRISSMCKGEMKIESEKDKGTKVTVLFYK